jgi:hypothetical protein
MDTSDREGGATRTNERTTERERETTKPAGGSGGPNTGQSGGAGSSGSNAPSGDAGKSSGSGAGDKA